MDPIYSLYDAAMSNPYPDEWLEKCADGYRNIDINDIKASERMKLLWRNVLEDLNQAQLLVEEARASRNQAGGPYLYDLDGHLAAYFLLIHNAMGKKLWQRILMVYVTFFRIHPLQDFSAEKSQKSLWIAKL